MKGETAPSALAVHGPPSDGSPAHRAGDNVKDQAALGTAGLAGAGPYPAQECPSDGAGHHAGENFDCHFQRHDCYSIVSFARVAWSCSRTISCCGPAGAGYTAKLCNQILGALHLIAAAEAILLAETAGIDLDAMLQAVTSGAAGNWILSNLGPKMINGNFEPGFSIDYQLKDLRLASDIAHKLKLPLPASALAETIFRAASAQGYGRKGTQAVYAAMKALRGFSA